VGIAVGVSVGIIIVAIVAVVVYVLVKRGGVLMRHKNGAGIPHQRFSDEVFAGVEPDGSIAMHNQMFDLHAADDPSDPTKFMAAEGEITLGDEKAVYHNGNGSTGSRGRGRGREGGGGGGRNELDNGFSNPLYSVMQPRDCRTQFGQW
jgi:hypothetical protein